MGTPQSYVPDGPSMRGARGVGFDPYLQAQKMLKKYLDRGHEASKVELMVEGGTFLAMPRDYQEWFIKGAFDGLNCATSPSPSLRPPAAACPTPPAPPIPWAGPIITTARSLWPPRCSRMPPGKLRVAPTITTTLALRIKS